MDGRELHDLALETSLELPASELTFPFGPDWEVVKVVGRMFALTTGAVGSQILNLKVEPREGRALVEQYANVIPGYHMNKTHWVTILPEGERDFGSSGASNEGDGDEEVQDGPWISRAEIEELIVSSYLLVVAGLPKKDRPIDPYAYGEAHDVLREKY